MFRRVLLAATLTLTTAGAAFGVTVSTAAVKLPAGACAISGTANISPGLSTKARAFTYTFTGSFTNCKGGDGSLRSGTVTASGSGSGSCATSKTTGTASITWQDGRVSAINFSTTGAAAALTVLGKVVSGPMAGSNAKAGLVFEATPTDCNSTAGVTTPAFNGAGELGK